MKNFSWFFSSALIAAFLLEGSWCVRILDVGVPPQVRARETVKLTCTFDLEDKNLYSLNWWKGSQQFYQFTTSGPLQQTIYNTPGIHVDRSMSGLNAVVLRNVTTKTSGRFKCEVVAEFPSYERDAKSAIMEVVEVPHRPPVLSLRRLQFSIGDILEANCSSPGIKPQSNLVWFINGEKVHPQHYRLIPSPPFGKNPSGSDDGVIHVGEMDDLYVIRVNEAPLPPITSHVKMVLRHNHFANGGRATLTCAALLPGLYRKSTDAHITLPGVSPMTSFHRISKGSRIRLPKFGVLILAISIIFLSNVRVISYPLKDFAFVYYLFHEL